MKILGSCHCGNIKYEFSSRVNQSELVYRDCACGFCSKHGAIYTSDSAGALVVEVRDPSMVSHYRFATKVVDFVFCATCGIMPLAKISIDDQWYGVINVRTSDIDLDSIKITKLKTAAESPEEALERRRNAWTPISRMRGLI
jgi:hypothetical protein